MLPSETAITHLLAQLGAGAEDRPRRPRAVAGRQWHRSKPVAHVEIARPTGMVRHEELRYARVVNELDPSGGGIGPEPRPRDDEIGAVLHLPAEFPPRLLRTSDREWLFDG